MSSSVFSFDKEKEATNILFAVPKKGRLYDKCLKLLDGAGLEYDRPHRLDVAHCTSLPVTLVFLPAADIATYVGEGNVDIGITGVDVVRESDEEVDTILVSRFMNHWCGNDACSEFRLRAVQALSPCSGGECCEGPQRIGRQANCDLLSFISEEILRQVRHRQQQDSD